MNSHHMSPAIFEFSSLSENLAAARAFVRGFLKSEGIAERESEALVLGVDEACSNIIRHAYGADAPRPISLTCERQENVLCFRLRDFGARVDPAQFNRRPLDRVEPGGLGLYVIEHIFDEAVYSPQQIGTELVLIKRLP
jgi:anti-sigma regulatory factor (Ser/Thr protein kinase)